MDMLSTSFIAILSVSCLSLLLILKLVAVFASTQIERAEVTRKAAAMRMAYIADRKAKRGRTNKLDPLPFPDNASTDESVAMAA